MKSYMVSKHGVVALTEGLAADLQDTRIGVSVLCPAHHEPSGIYENSSRHRPDRYGGPMTSEAALLAREAEIRRRRPARWSRRATRR
jgi:NAD(P)-dependent dehydrogenase (short-subunit alcohol dehydrogenase family)